MTRLLHLLTMGKILLGIDYGLKKIGLAISVGPLAAPLRTMRFDNEAKLVENIARIAKEERVEELIISVSDGEIAECARAFGKKLSNNLLLPIHFVDETLSTKDAQAMSIEAGINRKKRKSMEDAFAAALILQSYLDSQQ